MSIEQTRLGGRVLAFGVLLAALGLNAGSGKGPVPSAQTRKAKVDAALSRRLESFDVERTRLDDALKVLSEKSGLKILADWRHPNLDDNKRIPVTVHLRDVSAEQILSLLFLDQGDGVDFLVEGDGVRIVPVPIKSEPPRVERVYDVRDILPLLVKEQNGLPIGASLYPYVDPGAPYLFYTDLSLDSDKGMLQATGSPLSLQKVQQFLHLLRHPIVPTKKGVTKDAVSAGEAKVLAALKRKCDKALDGPKTLGDVVDLLREDGGFNIYMMLWEHSRAEFRKAAASLETRGLTYGEILTAMVKEANERFGRSCYNYVLIGPFIVVSTDATLKRHHIIVRAYDVGAVLAQGRLRTKGPAGGPPTTGPRQAHPRTAAELVATIRRLVKPFEESGKEPWDRWSSSDCKMQVLGSKLLVVRHNWYAHRKILEYLMSLEGRTEEGKH